MINKNQSQSFVFLLIFVFGIISIRYFASIHVPGPMSDPIKYKILTGSFHFLIDLSQFFQIISGIPYYTSLNMIADSSSRFRIHSFDHDDVLYHDRYIEDILVRIYTPKNISNEDRLPVIVYIHGGGFFFGSIYSIETMNYYLSLYSNTKIIAVNYRLTPMVHYPIPIEDNLKVVRYVMNNPNEFSIDPTQIFLCGDSAGGNIATVVERQLRQNNQSTIRGLILLYPLLQLVHFRLPSYLTYLPYHIISLLREDLLTHVTNFYLNTSFTKFELFSNQHLSIDDYERFYSKLNLSIVYSNDHQINKSHPDTWRLFDDSISPLLVDETILFKTPSIFLAACSYDVLLSDSQLYFQRLKKLQVNDVIYKEYPIFHGATGFVDYPVAFDEAFEMIHDCAHFIRNRTDFFLRYNK